MVKRPGGSAQGLHVPQHPLPEAQEEEEVDQYSWDLETLQALGCQPPTAIPQVLVVGLGAPQTHVSSP